MATSTDVPIYTTTLGAVSSVTIDLSAYQQYTNLKMVVSARRGIDNAGGGGLNIIYNNDSASNYSSTLFYEGSPYSAKLTNSSNLGYIGSAADKDFALNIIYIMNYSNPNIYKSTICRYGSAVNGNARAAVGTWRSNAAITSITMTPPNGFAAGTKIDIYGIGSATGGDSTSKASGGEVFSDSTYYYHVFKGTGTFKPVSALTADILVVAGGGAGASAGGGGGAGGVTYFASQSLTATTYPCLVGAGGAGSNGSGSLPTNGSNSVFGSLTAAIGGGYAGGYGGGAGYWAANSGGSGGGAPYYTGLGAGSGTAGQGNSGNVGYQGTGGGDPRSGGGGGGAGGAATNGGVANTGGNGGIGTSSYSSWGLATNTGQNVSGTVYYAGGGGGQGGTVGGSGGYGGGGNGIINGVYPSNPGTPNTGGGGGGGWYLPALTYTGANGGSGVIIVRYAK
jgi:hypothetical protein